jgi:hypothetical protein
MIVHMRAVRLTIVVFALGLAAQAQYPGQYPPGQYPPGQYPPGRNPGQYPPNGRGGPQGGIPGRGRNASKTPNIPVTTYGLMRTTARNQFVIEADDHRIITFRMATTTIVQKDTKNVDIATFAAGDHVVVDSSEDDRGMLTATEVRWDHAGTPEERTAAMENWDLPRLDGQAAAASSASAPQRDPGDDRPVLRRKNDDGSNTQAAQASPAPPPPAQAAAPPAAVNPDDLPDARPTTTMRPSDLPRDADDNGPPSLRHGAPGTASAPKPKLRVPVPAASSGESASASPVIAPKPQEPRTTVAQFEEDAVIAKARDVAAQFSGVLPNFFCQQVTTRYQSDHPKTGWDALDIVTADVAYENGKESYKNIKIGSKPVKQAMEDIEGTHSTGEFSSILEGLLDPGTAAVFRRTGTETIHGRTTYVFHFDVPRERSRWRVEAPSQLYYPAYSGSLWIDKQTSRALRIEQQARTMPILFPFDTIETATDYDFVRLSTPEQFLLPVNAEVLSCVRGTSTCARNKIEFRNYRKFGADTSITFESKPQQ